MDQLVPKMLTLVPMPVPVRMSLLVRMSVLVRMFALVPMPIHFGVMFVYGFWRFPKRVLEMLYPLFFFLLTK